MSHLALALLGPFQATLGGQPVQGLNSEYLRALLAYLAVERGREHTRETLASLLWPERTEREAVSALRHALANLRVALGDPGSPSPVLLVTRSSVQLNPAGDYWLDVDDFGLQMANSGLGKGAADSERGASQAPGPAIQDPESQIGGLESAIALYRGPFLHGLSVRDSLAFDEWMLFRGEEYRRNLLSLLGQLTALQLARGATAEAARWARRQLELEPYREQAHRQLMAALALGGERPAALAQYETCRRLLAEELGCEPDDETQVLYAQIRVGVETRRWGDTETRRRGEIVSPPPPISASPRLPLPASRFVARERELARLGSLLEGALTGRGGVALIAGEAGSGKTALLGEFARRACLDHGDLIALRGSCNAHGGAGDPYLPFRELLRALAGDVEGERAAGTLSPEQARRAWEALPAVGAALAEHGPDLIDTFVPAGALLQRAEGFRAPPAGARSPAPQTPQCAGSVPGQAWQVRLRELAQRAQEGAAPAPQADLFAQVTRVLRSVSLRRPLLLAIDDLQWADGGTAALLFHLGRHLAGSRILLACAYRPEAGPKGLERPLGSILQELAREWGDVLVDLDRADGRAFVEAYVDSEPNRLGEGFRQALYDHTEGNPLFTVELLRSLERQGALVREEAGQWTEAPGLDWEQVPARVEAVIAGHLAGLPDENRALLQAASVQGERFAAEVAARVLGWDEDAAARRLSGPLRTGHRLVEAVSLERLPSTGQRLSNYRFRHLLVQRSAYGSLDPVQRARLHEATGRALEVMYAQGERPAGLAADLARHYEAAGMAVEAAHALHDAGREAMRLSALREALGMFDRGLALLADESRSPQRAEVERLLQVARLGPRATLGGTGSLQLAGDLARAAGAVAGDERGRPKLLMLQADVNLLNARGQFEECFAAVGQMLEEATQFGDETFAALAHFWFGHLHHLTGKSLEADRRFERAIAGLTPERSADLRAAVGSGLEPLALSFSALNRWMLGYPERALARSAAALTGTLEQKDLFGQAFASAIGSMVLFLLRSDPAALQARAEPGYRLCLREGIAWWQDYIEVFLGWLAVLRGDPDGDAGIEQMRSAIAAWQAKGMAVGTDGLLVVLAEGCLLAARRCRPGDGTLHTGRLAIGLSAMEPVLGPGAACGQSFQPELLRLRGELLLERDGLAAAGEALACFRQAWQLGQDQGALGWELRAAMSLVRLRERQGEACAAGLAEARECLRGVYGRFTEGFDLPDLRDAAALIAPP